MHGFLRSAAKTISPKYFIVLHSQLQQKKKKPELRVCTSQSVTYKCLHVNKMQCDTLS